MTPLDQDTLADKVVRFVIGALLGAVSAWLGMFHWGISDTRSFLLLAGAWVVFSGAAAAILGNRFIERYFRDGWWD